MSGKEKKQQDATQDDDELEDDDDLGDDDEDDENDDDDDTGDDDEDEDDSAAGKTSKSTTKTAKASEDQTPKFTQADLDRMVANRLKRQKRRLMRELGNSNGNKQLDEDTKNRLADLEELEELAEERYEQELETLPEAIRDLAPDDDEPILVKERWLVEKARPAAAKLRDKDDESQSGTRRARRGNNQKDPPPNRKKSPEERRKELREQMKSDPAYRRVL